MALPPIIRTIAATLISDASEPSRTDRILALTWGVMLTLCVTGYTFGQSNHHVYLLDALRIQHPETLARDWFTNHTLQYHFLFTQLVLGLKKLAFLQPGFFLLYLLLATTMHWAWMSITLRIGGGLKTYLLATLIYHLSAGGLGLGVYQFLQDGSFLSSNVSSVAALVALAFWLDRRLIAASIAVAISGLFHVNYAILLVGVWGLVSGWSWYRGEQTSFKRHAVATLIAMPSCLLNVVVAAIESMKHSADIPMEEFVALYVRLRHEHHHDPLRWPVALWLSFLWPLPLAFIAIRQIPSTLATRRLNLALVITLGIITFAFVFAGIWFVSGTIVKLSLFRFSIFPKLITCTYAAWFLLHAAPLRKAIPLAIAALGIAMLLFTPLRNVLPESIPSPHAGFLIGTSLLMLGLAIGWLRAIPVRWCVAVAAIALPVCLFFASRQQLGVAMPGENDTEMVAVCRWARDNTPASALFLTPPHDAFFSLDAQRSSVIGFKQVPQLSAEIVAWRKRLSDVLDMDILSLPTPMPRTLKAMATRYQSLSSQHLHDVAIRYDCDYIIAMQALPDASEPAFVSPQRRYFVYAIPRRSTDTPAVTPTSNPSSP